MALHVAVVMDPIGAIKIAKDTSFAMLLEAQRRGHQLHYVAAGQPGRRRRARPWRDWPRCRCMTTRPTWYELARRRDHGPLAEMDVVLMRTDPPVDANYLHDTHHPEHGPGRGRAGGQRPAGPARPEREAGRAAVPAVLPADAGQPRGGDAARVHRRARRIACSSRWTAWAGARSSGSATATPTST